MNDRFDEDEPLLADMPGLPDGAFDGPAPPEALYDAVWRSTAGRVRRRRYYRRILAVSAVAAAYAGGLATTFALFKAPASAPPRNAPTAVTESVASAKDKPVLSVESAPDPAQRGITRPLGNREALARRISEASPEERARLLKQAGDRYLKELGDIETALNCYRRLLDSLPASERGRVGRNDSWLLVALKESRREEETNHERAS